MYDFAIIAEIKVEVKLYFILINRKFRGVKCHNQIRYHCNDQAFAAPVPLNKTILKFSLQKLDFVFLT